MNSTSYSINAILPSTADAFIVVNSPTTNFLLTPIIGLTCIGINGTRIYQFY